MTKYYSHASIALTMPDGIVVPPLSPDAIDVDKDAAKHPVVASWIESGMLSKTKQGDKPSAPTAKTVEVKVADLESPEVKKAIDDAVDAKLAAAKKAYEDFASLPADAANEVVTASTEALEQALGLKD